MMIMKTMVTDKSLKAKARADASKEFVTLAKKYEPARHYIGAKGRGKVDIKDWHISVKVDGIRARYKDGKLWTRSQKLICAPHEFLQSIEDFYPGLQLDGELVHVSNNFNKTVSIVRNQKNPHMENMWDGIIYKVFDHVAEGPYYKRMETLQKIENSIRPVDILTIDGIAQIDYPTPVHVHGPLAIVNDDKIINTLKKQALNNNWEGLILRDPDMPYIFGRTQKLLKVKGHEDCEVTVIEHLEGEGKFSGMLGTLVCRMQSGKIVEVGTGFSDQQRKNPPLVGSIVTIRYMELTDKGIPRHPVFINIRDYE
jgi:DNA ligase-1